MNIKSFEEIAIGETSEIHRQIAQNDVDRFVALTGDDNPLHVDKEFARKTSFKNPVVHGMLAGSLISTLIGKHLPGPGALWVKQEFRFLGPVRIGDELTLRAVVVAKNDRDRMIDLDIEATVKGRGAVLRGRGTVSILEIDQLSLESSSPIPARRALVTGATGEIGSAIARELAADGFHVLLHSASNRTQASALMAEIMDSGGSCDHFECDLSNLGKTERFIEDLIGRFGTIDTLVLNASEAINDADIAHTTIQNLESSFSVQLYSSLRIIQKCLPSMSEQKWGRIIGISSDAVHVQPVKGWFSYITAKTTLELLVKQCAIELGPRGVSANVVAPGMTDTGFIGNIPPRARQVTAQTTPTRRLATPKDVASTVLFLCKVESGHINGQTIRVNGGIGISQ
jgi:3-oxoacyl-[acyl-carrier protein] reductase